MMQELNDLKQHVDRRLDRIEEKLDGHMERLTRNEADVTWVKGQTKLVLTIIISAAGFLASLYFTK